MRVLLDTNVLVSAIATRGICEDLLQLVVAHHDLLVGQTVRQETRRVLREKIGLPANVIAEFETFLERHGTRINASEAVTAKLRDSSDVPVLSEAAAANADALVTGDRDLLELPAPTPVPIMNPRMFWEHVRASPR